MQKQCLQCGELFADTFLSSGFFDSPHTKFRVDCIFCFAAEPAQLQSSRNYVMATIAELTKLFEDSRAREAAANEALAEAEAALQEERASRRALEQTMFLGEARATASARRVRVSGIIFLSGILVFGVAAPLTFVTIFGFIHSGSFGHALGGCPTSYCWLLLALMPTDAMPIRFVGGFTIFALCGFAAIFLLAAALMGTQVQCAYGTVNTCRAVASGVACFAVLCVAMIVPFARTLRQRRGGPYVSLSGVRRATCAKLGPTLGTLAFVLALPVAWALAQEDSSFVLSPRMALHAYWANFRFIFTVWSFMWVVVVLVAIGLGASLDSEPVLPSLIVCLLCFLLVAVSCSPKNRGRIHELLGRLGTLGQAKAAAGISGLLNGRDPKLVMGEAEKHFRGLPFEQLSSADLHSNEDTGLHARTLAKKLGQVDCFVSHSWHDPAAAKWAALQGWAKAFADRESRQPVIWLECVKGGWNSGLGACTTMPIAFSLRMYHADTHRPHVCRYALVT